MTSKLMSNDINRGKCFVFACGSNSHGQLGLGHEEDQWSLSPTLIEFESHFPNEEQSKCNKNTNNFYCIIDKVKQIAIGSTHSLLLTNNGTLFGAGTNRHGQLGNICATAINTDDDTNNNNDHSKSNNTSDPNNGNKQTHPKSINVFTRILLTDEMKPEHQNVNICQRTSLKSRPEIVYIACGWDSSYLINENGQILVFGNNCHGQLGLGPSLKTVHEPTFLFFNNLRPFSSDITTTSNNNNNNNNNSNIAISTFNNNLTDSQEHHQNSSFCHVPYFIKIVAGIHSCLALTNQGEVWGWGSNKKGMLGIPLSSCSSNSTVIYYPTKVNLHSLDLNVDQHDPHPTHFSSCKNGPSSKVIDIAIGQFHSVLLLESGELLVSGSNKFGQLGFSPQKEPVLLYKVRIKFSLQSHVDSNIDIPSEICSGWHHSVLLMKKSNNVFTMGKNDFNQLGNRSDFIPGSIEKDSYPIIKSDFGIHHAHQFKSIACGSESIYIIDNEYSLYSCGWNEHGNCMRPPSHFSLLSKLRKLPFSFEMGSFCSLKAFSSYASTFLVLYTEECN